jgi:hypothetical protein
MNDPMKAQVGGNHYKNLAIQPFEFTMANGWDAASHTILKYVHRAPGKNGLEDLEKALHVCDIRFTQMQRYFQPMRNGCRVHSSFAFDPTIPMRNYIDLNRITHFRTDMALMALERWVHASEPSSGEFHAGYQDTRAAITTLIQEQHFPNQTGAPE